jgi:hypothetical protein
VQYDSEGQMSYPRLDDTAPETALKEHLEEGASLLAGAAPAFADEPGDLVSEDFEHLRWFELPGACLSP